MAKKVAKKERERERDEQKGNTHETRMSHWQETQINDENCELVAFGSMPLK